MDDTTKRTVAASAELLRERVRNDHTGRGEPDETDQFDESLLRDFRERFGDQTDSLAAYANFDSWPDDEPLPEWVETFSDVVDHCRAVEQLRSRGGEHDAEVPFEDVFSPVVGYASGRFADEVDATRLSDDALRDFERHLLDRLADVGAQALHVDFLRFVAERDPGAVEEDRRSPDSTRLYDEYVSACFDGRLVPVFETYPVLARLVAVVVEQWGAVLERFVSRLNDDYAALCDLLGCDDLGSVAGVDPGAGDLHDEGQSVVFVEFETGDEVVYKPRAVEAERRLYEFVSWLDRECDGFPALQAPDVLSRPSHGWVERVERATFENPDAVADYYERAGALLCVLYALDASDCHFENVVAGETSPVLVDAETVPNVPIVEPGEPGFEARVHRRVERTTLLGTTMVPVELGGNEVAHSGLGMVDERAGRRHQLSWTDVNTDAMDVEYRRRTRGPGDNFPVYRGQSACSGESAQPARPEQFVDEIVAGFESAYDAMLDAQDAVKRRATDLFAGVRVRNVLHQSMAYGALLDTTTNPEYLRSGVAHGARIHEALSRRFAALPDDADAILDAERRAIFRRDVPRFTTRTDSNEIRFDGATVYSLDAEETGLDRIRTRIENLSGADAAHQRALIRACFGGSGATESRGCRGL